MRSPVVLVSACIGQSEPHPYHGVQRKYVEAVLSAAHCSPLIVPALGAASDFESMLAIADGIMLTGSSSNLDPGLYGQELKNTALPLDRWRDATTLPLIRLALARRIPLLAVCRGFQEMNVALGGTLHQALCEVPGMAEHREDKASPLEKQYARGHKVQLVAGGILAGILGSDEIWVNSLHGQGIDRLAPGLVVEARAADGLVEAFRVSDGGAFALGVQWHPEWRAIDNPDSVRLFAAFGQSCRSHQHERVP